MKRAAALALTALLLATAVVVVQALAPTEPTPTAATPAPRAPTPPATAAAPVEYTPRAPAPAADTARRSLDLRIDGLTLADALAGIARHAAGRHPDHNRWLYRVSGFLHRHPAHCAAFAAAALGPDATPHMQALAADVLAGVGHPAARGALRDLIDRSALGPAVRHRLLQSHLRLPEPAPEAADWLARHLDDPVAGPAAANALGAVAGRLAETHPAEAEAAMRRLRQGLAAADDAHDQRAHLLGLGNSGLPGAVDALPYTESDDPAVRRAAARALRHLDTPQARDALHRLAADPEPAVRNRAVEALAERIDPTDTRLADLARGGALGGAAEGALLSAALRAPTAAPLLAALADGAGQPRVRERARAALLAARRP